VPFWSNNASQLFIFGVEKSIIPQKYQSIHMCKNEAICTLLITFKGTPFTLSAKNIVISVVYSWASTPSHMENIFNILIYPTKRRKVVRT